MPHTLAHPAAILPLVALCRGSLSVSALVIGSIAPDLAYFLPLEVTRRESHSAAGLLWFCLPVGVAGYLAFHVWVAPLLADVVPAALRERLPRAWTRGALPRVRWWSVALALSLGALTHVTWDAFTHAGDPGVRAFPWLGEPLARVGGYPLRPYKLLQHGGSLLGALAIALCLRRAWRAAAASDPMPEESSMHNATLSTTRRVCLAALVLLPPAALVLRALWVASFELSGVVPRLDHVFTVASFDGGAALLGTSLAVGASWRFVRAAG